MEWGFIILILLATPIVIVLPLIIWAGAIIGVLQLIRDRLRSKAHVKQTAAAVQEATRFLSNHRY